MKVDLFALTSPGGTHPLWSFIRSSNLATGPGIVFEKPRSPLFGFMPIETRHVYERVGTRELMYLSSVLFSFLKGEDFDGGDKDYEPFMEVLNFVTANREGAAMALVSGLAYQSEKFMPAFAASSRLIGFVPAISNWIEKAESPNDWKELLSRDWQTGGNPLYDDYIFREALKASKDSAEFAAEISQLNRRRQNAKAQKYRRAKPERQSEFKDRIRAGWILAALWARTPSGILQVLDAKDQSTSQVDKVTADISRLGLTRGRSESVYEDEAIIEAAERKFREWFDSKQVP